MSVSLFMHKILLFKKHAILHNHLFQGATFLTVCLSINAQNTYTKVFNVKHL